MAEQLETEVEEPEDPPTPTIDPAPPARRITPEEEAAILARADELNARVAALLAE